MSVPATGMKAVTGTDAARLPPGSGAVPLKSAQFRREREASWRQLEQLLEQIERAGLRRVPSEALLKLPSLYRAILSGLSVARSISLDSNLVGYLEALAARAYFHVYGPRGSFFGTLGAYVGRQMPAVIRALSGHILFAAALFLLGGAAGFALTAANADWFYTFMDSDMAAGRTPAATTEFLRETLFDPPPATDFLALFSSALFAHNAKIALLCFTLGIAFGLPTVLLLFSNGLSLGAFLALFAARGLGLDCLGWLWIHGTTEIFAVIIAGAAGTAIGSAVLFPGEKSRLDNLAIAGRRASLLGVVAVLMLFVAGLLEGFGRQIINDTTLRFVIGSFMLLGWLSYFAFAGRSQPADEDPA